MFTVEFDYDSTSIISIDETDTHEDVEMILADDGTVLIRQFDDNMDEFQLIYISYQQLIDLVVSLRQTEGAYYHKRL